jgi:hypothetical protein
MAMVRLPGTGMIVAAYGGVSGEFRLEAIATRSSDADDELNRIRADMPQLLSKVQVSEADIVRAQLADIEACGRFLDFRRAGRTALLRRVRSPESQ